MRLEFSVFVVPLALAAVITAALSVVVFRNRYKRTAPQILAILVATFVWATADALRLVTVDASLELLWHDVRFLGSTLVVLAVVLHALEYTGREERLSRDSIAALASLLVVTNVLVWVGHVHDHDLIYAGFEQARVGSAVVLEVEYGPWFFTNAAYSYLLLVAAMGMYVQEFFRQTGTYRRQTAGLVVALAVPWALNGLFLAGVTPIDMTAFGFTVTAVAFVAQFYWFRLLDVVPIARSTAIDHVGNGYLVVDDENLVLDANEAGVDLIGGSPDGVVGRTVDELFRDSSNVVEVDDGDGTVTLLQDGERRYYDVDTSPVYDGSDQIIGHVLLFHDGTEQRRRQQALERRTRELERQNERLDRFASIISHDIREPLVVARTELENVREKGDRVSFYRLEDALDRIEEITDDVLELARESEDAIEREPVDLARLCDRSWNAVDTGESTLVVDTDLTLEADPGRLRQALENLFQNAVEHADGPVTVRVGDLPGGFYVADDGPGIPPEHREEVFDHGFTTADGASGLGLAIVDRCVKAHAWLVGITDTEAGGARFEFTDVEEADPDLHRADDAGVVEIGGFIFGIVADDREVEAQRRASAPELDRD